MYKNTGRYWSINSESSLNHCIECLKRDFAEKGFVSIAAVTSKNESPQALTVRDLYLGRLARALNEKSIDVRDALKKTTRIFWMLELVRLHLWQAEHDHFAKQLKPKGITEIPNRRIHARLNDHTRKRFGIDIPYDGCAVKQTVSGEPR